MGKDITLKLWSVATIVLLGLTGCGADQMPLGQVSGVVTAGGQPLSSGVIHFVPQAGPKASGVLDQQGGYRLTTYVGGDGAITGRHQVYFTPLDDDTHMDNYTDADYQSGKIPPEPSPQEFLPQKYLAPATSGLSEQVAAGSNSFNFALETD